MRSTGKALTMDKKLLMPAPGTGKLARLRKRSLIIGDAASLADATTWGGIPNDNTERKKVDR